MSDFKSMDDIFKKPDEIEPESQDLNAEQITTIFENGDKTEVKTAPKFQPKLPKNQNVISEPVIPVKDEVTDQRIMALENEIRKLVAGQNGVKIGKEPKKLTPIDFSKISENDIYTVSSETGSFEVPIEAIDHELPEYLKVDLKDQSYSARWIHKTARRLGPMLASGWTYVSLEDLESDSAVRLKDTIDENGHIKFDDVILCKCPKVKYFGQLRRNHMRAVAQVDPKRHHELSKKAVEGALASAAPGGRDSKGYRQYVQENKLEVFIPGEK